MIFFGKINNKSCVFVPTLDSAKEYIKDFTKSTIAEVPIAMVNEYNRYFITSSCRLFFIRHVSKRFSINEKKIEQSKNGKYPIVRLSIGHKKEISRKLSLVMYNAFVRKKWSEVEPKHIDRNPFNCSISNLIDERVLENHEIKDMELQSFPERFTKVSDILLYLYGHKISREDAEDIAANAYIETYCNNSLQAKHANNKWLKTARHRALDFIEHNKHVRYIDSVDLCKWRCECHQYYGEKIDIISLVEGNKAKTYLRYYLQGYTPTEIAHEFNTTRSNVASIITKQIKRIKIKLQI